MKQSLIILLLILRISLANAQTIIEMPTTQEWQTYFYERTNAIETKLYHLALTGKIKAYKNDSLTTLFSIDDLKFKNGLTTTLVEYMGNDVFCDTIITTPYSTKILNGLLFNKSKYSNPFKIDNESKLYSIALTYSPYNQNKNRFIKPIFWISINEIKKNLTKQEFEYISLLYYYCKNEYLIDDFAIYDDLNSSLNKYQLKTDSIFYLRLLITLINIDLSFNQKFYSNTSSIKILDHQNNKKINYYEFTNSYQNLEYNSKTFDTLTQTEIDSSIYSDPYSNYTGFKYFSIYNNKLISFIIEIHTKNYYLKEEKLNKFSVDIKDIPALGPQNPLSWFFEDYFRWKKI